MGVILFIISFALVIASSYLLTSTLKEDKPAKYLVYFGITVVSLVIIQFEVLSIIESIHIGGILTANFMIFLTALWFWNYKGRYLLNISGIEDFRNRINFAFKRDKILFILYITLIFSLLISLFLAIAVPTNNFDCMVYHMSRVAFWLQNQTMAHFETPDVRQVIFPVNSEILIMWPMAFLKRDFLAPIVQYLAGIGVLGVLYFCLRYLKVTIRRSLWTVLIFASLPAFIVEMSSTQTNLLLGFFLICSFYLFMRGVKENDFKAVSFSAISFAIAIGVKTTALYFIPLFGLFFVWVLNREKIKELAFYIAGFLVIFVPAFLLLSSYNYVLNFLNYGNPLGTELYIESFKSAPAIKSFISNIIRYFLLFIDFTGIKAAEVFNETYLSLKDSLFNLLAIDPSQGLEAYDIKRLNTKNQENYAKFGILGFLLFLPLVFRHSFTGWKSKKDKKFYLNISGLLTPGFIVVISLLMEFLYWNNRYLLTAIALSAPIFAYSYSRKLTALKLFLAGVMVYNFIIIPTSIVARPYPAIVSLLMKHNLTDVRQAIRLRNDVDFSVSPYFYLVRYLKHNIPDNSTIGLVFYNNSWYYSIQTINPTWKIHPIRYEKLHKYKNYNDYDYIIFLNERQKEHIINKNDIEYNYTVKGGKIFYKRPDSNELITLYTDRRGDFITEKPLFRINVIDFSRIPENFKHIKLIPVISVSKNKSSPRPYIFRIYEKKGEK